jgi:hypothetical protein
MSAKYALFVFDAIYNTTTFAAEHTSKEALIVWAHQKFKENMWFAIYKFSSHEHLFGSRISATKWYLDHKFAGKTAAEYCRCYTPMESAYRIDDHEWFFKTF